MLLGNKSNQQCGWRHLLWKITNKPDPPTQDDWLKIVNEIYVMEHLTHKIKDSPHINDRIRTIKLTSSQEQTVETQQSNMFIFWCCFALGGKIQTHCWLWTVVSVAYRASCPVMCCQFTCRLTICRLYNLIDHCALTAAAGTRRVHAHHSRDGDREGDEGEVLLCGSQLWSWAECRGVVLHGDALHNARRTDCHSQHGEV